MRIESIEFQYPIQSQIINPPAGGGEGVDLEELQIIFDLACGRGKWKDGRRFGVGVVSTGG